jgi:hypothetical protein
MLVMIGLVEVVVVEGVEYQVGQVGVLEVVVGVEYQVGQVGVLEDGKKMMSILMISLGLFFPSSFLVLESLGAAVSYPFLAECHHLENHCRLLVPTSSQIAGYPGVC